MERKARQRYKCHIKPASLLKQALKPEWKIFLGTHVMDCKSSGHTKIEWFSVSAHYIMFSSMQLSNKVLEPQSH